MVNFKVSLIICHINCVQKKRTMCLKSENEATMLAQISNIVFFF